MPGTYRYFDGTYEYDRKKWPSLNPDPRWCALLMTGRKCLGLTLKEAAARLGRSFETLVNGEHCRYRLSQKTEARLIKMYVREFAQRGGYEVDGLLEGASLAELRAALARSILAHKTGSLVLTARGTDGSAEDLVNGVIASAVAEKRIPPKMRERLLGVSL